MSIGDLGFSRFPSPYSFLFQWFLTGNPYADDYLPPYMPIFICPPPRFLTMLNFKFKIIAVTRHLETRPKNVYKERSYYNVMKDKST